MLSRAVATRSPGALDASTPRLRYAYSATSRPPCRCQSFPSPLHVCLSFSPTLHSSSSPGRCYSERRVHTFFLVSEGAGSSHRFAHSLVAHGRLDFQGFFVVTYHRLSRSPDSTSPFPPVARSIHHHLSLFTRPIRTRSLSLLTPVALVWCWL